MLDYSEKLNIFRWTGNCSEVVNIPAFKYSEKLKGYVTQDPYSAELLSSQSTAAAQKALGAGRSPFKQNIPAPKGCSYRQYQIEASDRILSQKSTLLHGDMGIGKTIIACRCIRVCIGPILILCPAVMKYTWADEIIKWCEMKPEWIHIAGADENRGTTVTICNYARLDELPDINWDFMVVDESHYIKTPEAQRTRKTISIKADRKLFMTGTPVLNRPKELYTQLRMLHGFKVWGTYREFTDRFCDPKVFKVGHEYKRDVDGASNLGILKKLLRTHGTVRIKKSDVLSELPEKIYRTVKLAPVNRLAGDTELVMDEISSGALTEEQIFGVLSELRRETGEAKFPKVKKYIDDILLLENKVVVFAHHKTVINSLADAYGDKSRVVSGKVSPENKQKAVKDFQTEDSIKVFIGSIHAAGIGITLHAASTVIFAELDWTPGVMDQAQDRVHRMGQKSVVDVHYLVLKQSLDENILRAVKRKRSIINELTR